MIAKRIYYAGRVQGVGFRFTAKQIAAGYEVSGWVKNLPDGRVEMLAASWDDEELDAFLDEIDDSNLGSLIKEKEVEDVDPPDGLAGFTIAR